MTGFRERSHGERHSFELSGKRWIRVTRMRLNPGTRLGPHEILGPLGAGGMGEVYLARDTRLDRDVALKLLPQRMAHDSEAITRFRREALTLASLNHPNIATVFGFEESP